MANEKSQWRALTLEKAKRFADLYANDVTHNLESASVAARLTPVCIRSAIHRFRHGKCMTETDYEICSVVFQAKCDHHQLETKLGTQAADEDKATTVGWYKWRLAIGDRFNHQERHAVDMELSGDPEKPLTSEQKVVLVLPDNGRVKSE